MCGFALNLQLSDKLFVREVLSSHSFPNQILVQMPGKFALEQVLNERIEVEVQLENSPELIAKGQIALGNLSCFKPSAR